MSKFTSTVTPATGNSPYADVPEILERIAAKSKHIDEPGGCPYGEDGCEMCGGTARASWNVGALQRTTRKKRSATSETSSITNPLRDALNAIPGLSFTRIPVGGYRGRTMGAPEGTPDLMGTVKGKAAVIETKAPGGKLSKAQREWYQAYGHLYLYGIATSVADGVELVKGWMK